LGQPPQPGGGRLSYQPTKAALHLFYVEVAMSEIPANYPKGKHTPVQAVSINMNEENHLTKPIFMDKSGSCST